MLWPGFCIRRLFRIGAEPCVRPVLLDETHRAALFARAALCVSFLCIYRPSAKQNTASTPIPV